jgi:hypothetical protein
MTKERGLTAGKRDSVVLQRPSGRGDEGESGEALASRGRGFCGSNNKIKKVGILGSCL